LVTLSIDPSATNHPLSYWDTVAQNWDLMHGKLSFYLGRSSGDIVNTALTTIVFPSSGIVGDVNGDGVVNCQDLMALKLAFGTHTGDPGFLPTADIDGNGVIDVNDMIAVTRRMTSC
jgi:hypothetical protein